MLGDEPESRRSFQISRGDVASPDEKTFGMGLPFVVLRIDPSSKSEMFLREGLGGRLERVERVDDGLVAVLRLGVGRHVCFF